MKIALGSIEVTTTQRAALAEVLGVPGLASRAQVRDFIVRHGTARLDALTRNFQRRADEAAERILA